MKKERMRKVERVLRDGGFKKGRRILEMKRGREMEKWMRRYGKVKGVWMR